MTTSLIQPLRVCGGTLRVMLGRLKFALPCRGSGRKQARCLPEVGAVLVGVKLIKPFDLGLRIA